MLEGRVAQRRQHEMARFVAAMEGSPWGDAPPARVVVAPLHDALRRWLEPEQWAEFKQRERLRGVYGAGAGGMAFVARDGVRTIAIEERYERREQEFLFLFGHEALESALAARHASKGTPDSGEQRIARALWGEYVVERIRRTIAKRLEWPASAFDRSYLRAFGAELARELADPPEHPPLGRRLPEALYRHSQLLALEFAKAVARADAGTTAEQLELGRFGETPFGRQTRDGWRSLAAALRDAFRHPERSVAELDALVRQGGWSPLLESLGAPRA